MSGMKTILHNVLDLNHYLVGSRTHTHGTPKVLNQISKYAAVMLSVHTATGFGDMKLVRSSMIAKYMSHPAIAGGVFGCTKKEA